MEALNSYAGERGTVIAAKELQNVIADLSRADADGNSQFDLEFKRLQNISSHS